MTAIRPSLTYAVLHDSREVLVDIPDDSLSRMIVDGVEIDLRPCDCYFGASIQCIIQAVELVFGVPRDSVDIDSMRLARVVTSNGRVLDVPKPQPGQTQYDVVRDLNGLIGGDVKPGSLSSLGDGDWENDDVQRAQWLMWRTPPRGGGQANFPWRLFRLCEFTADQALQRAQEQARKQLRKDGGYGPPNIISRWAEGMMERAKVRVL